MSVLTWKAWGMIEWPGILAAPRRANAGLKQRDIPTSPGVYAWFQGEECVYLGVASNLRRRLSTHRRKTTDLSRSTLRASVAVTLLGITRARARQRPSATTPDEIAVITTWFTTAAVTWIECGTADEARAAERYLLDTRQPPLNRTRVRGQP